MSVQQAKTDIFKSGVHNLLDDEQIPKDAASDSLNWLTRDGHVELMYGRTTLGSQGLNGAMYAQHIGAKVNGTAVHFRKAGTKIQYLNGSTWTDVITGLTEVADYTASNYQSLAGAFVYFFGVDGIYKICTANPASFTTLYDSTKNYKGFAFIDKGRTILWNQPKDPTGFYYSWIDNQRAVSGATGVYTAVVGEVTAGTSGTLAFKGGGATRTCFGVTITITAGGQVYTDDYNGILTGSLGGTGTINYTTGAWTVTAGGAGVAAYQWENSNLRGVTDFTYSATRVAGEGSVLRQDLNGTPIKTVIPLDGQYFSIKSDSCYQVTLDANDTTISNTVFRTDIGVKTLRSAVGTGKGIVFMNTINQSKPRLEILARNPLGDNFDVKPLFPHFSFENYQYDDVVVDSWDIYVIVGCKNGSDANDSLLLCNIPLDTVDITYYGARCFSKLNGVLYAGDSITLTTYELFSGFDDLTLPIQNYWDSKGEKYGSDVLKKVKRFRFKGQIDAGQVLEVYLAYDDKEATQIGTILGTGDYVDYSDSETIGTSMLGTSLVGGASTVDIYGFLLEIKIHSNKFRKRKIRFVATAIGYVSIQEIIDFDIWTYQEKLPSKYRVKQNVSIDGTETDQALPEY
jgi:hypothetical protein